MGRYPQTNVIRQDVIASFGTQPYGAFIKDGKIFPGWTAVNTTVKSPQNLTTMLWSKSCNYVLAGGSDGNAYAGSSGTELTPINLGGDGSPFTFEIDDGTPYVVLFDGNRYTAASVGGSRYSAVSAVGLACGTIRRNRLFGVDGTVPNMIRWSGTSSFANWNESINVSGNMLLPPVGGDILNLFDFEQELVVFRESAIMRFSIYGDPENFREIDVLRVPKIARNTAALAGDCILFFGDGGFMRYSGGKATRIDGLISDDLASPTSAFAYSDRYYFICGKSKRLARSVIYVYDLLCDCYEILNTYATFLSYDGISVLAYGATDINRLYLSGSTPYEVVSGSIDFGTDKRKLATLLEVDCDDGVEITVFNGKDTVLCKRPNGKTRLNFRGNSFIVTFSGTGAVRSAYLSAEVI